MGLFSGLYAHTMHWAGHRHAAWYLTGLSFAESSFFPVPPDVMLAPMVMARPHRAWRLAALTTVASVVGGLLGYLIGALALEAVTPLLKAYGYWASYTMARDWFAAWGLWVVLLAGFSPIPYKVFTIAAGAAAMPWGPFVIASLLGRGTRFFLIAGLLRWGGERVDQLLTRYVDRIGWAVVGMAVIAYLYTQL